MVRVLTTGDENADQVLSVPVPGRASPLAVRPLPGGEVGALIQPLSTVIYGDANTVVPTAQQTGSIAAPFALLSAAIAEVPDAFGGGRTIILTPGDYGAPVPIGEKSITFMGLAQPGSLDQPTIQVEPNASSVYFQNVSVFFDASNSPTIELLNCQAGGDAGGGTVFARETQFTGAVDGAATFRAFDCDVNILTADEAELDSCHLSGNIEVVGTLTIRNVRTVQPGLTIIATTIVVDSHTLRELVFAGATLTGTVTGYSGAVWQWGAAVATVNEFLDFGSRANPVSFPAEDTVRSFVGRRGVLCSLTAFASAGPCTFMVRRNAADSALSVVSNGAQVQNAAVFQAFNPDDTIDIQVTGTAGGQALCAAVFV